MYNHWAYFLDIKIQCNIRAGKVYANSTSVFFYYKKYFLQQTLPAYNVKAIDETKRRKVQSVKTNGFESLLFHGFIP